MWAPFCDTYAPMNELDREEYCRWFHGENANLDVYWMTDCGENHVFCNSLSPEENKYEYCPYCGRKLVEVW